MRETKVYLKENKPNVTYTDLLHLTRNRLIMIDEASKEEETANEEWCILKEVENNLWKLVKLQNGFKPSVRPKPSEVKPPQKLAL